MLFQTESKSTYFAEESSDYDEIMRTETLVSVVIQTREGRLFVALPCDKPQLWDEQALLMCARQKACLAFLL